MRLTNDLTGSIGILWRSKVIGFSIDKVTRDQLRVQDPTVSKHRFTERDVKRTFLMFMVIVKSVKAFTTALLAGLENLHDGILAWAAMTPITVGLHDPVLT